MTSIAIFWIALGLVAYAYAGFPLLLWLRARLLPRPHLEADVTPAVSVIIAAYNEEQSIAAKLENVLAVDYPSDQREILVVSDGSDNRTCETVRRFAERGVRLLQRPREGKAMALNAAVAQAQGEVLVFSDANSMFARHTLRALVRPFADPCVGGVAGNQCYEKFLGQAATASGEKSYWSLDRWTKSLQSQAGSVTSATGSLYAIRKRLFMPVVAGVTDDFATSTTVILQCHRLVFAQEAVAYEPVAASAGVEFGRKVRIMTRGFRGVLLRRSLLNPFQFGFYSLQLFSHKLLRRLVIFPLLAMLLVSPWLWHQAVPYKFAVAAQLATYGCAALGVLLGRTRFRNSKLLSLPLFLCVANAASLVAVFNLLRGHRVVLWQPQRGAVT